MHNGSVCPKVVTYLHQILHVSVENSLASSTLLSRGCRTSGLEARPFRIAPVSVANRKISRDEENSSLRFFYFERYTRVKVADGVCKILNRENTLQL